MSVRPGPAATLVHFGETPGALSAIALRDVGVAVWRRSLSPDVESWLDDLPADRLPRLRATLAPARTVGAVDDACRRAGLQEGAARTCFVADVAALAQRMATLAGVAAVRLRLDVQSGAGCTRFHLDNLRLRLLCAYRGAGTEYGAAAENGAPAQVARLPRGAAALFRGRRWPGQPSGVLHRSPDAVGGHARLLLAIDPDDPDEDDPA